MVEIMHFDSNTVSDHYFGMKENETILIASK